MQGKRLPFYDGPVETQPPALAALLLSAAVLVCGLAALALGVGILAAPMRVFMLLDFFPERVPLPLLAAGLFALGAALGGVGFLGARFALRRLAAEAGERAHNPPPPGYADRPWTRDGVDDGQAELILRYIIEMSGMLLFLIPVHVFGIFAIPQLLLAGAIFDGFLIWGIARTWRRMRGFRAFGAARLSFARFPFRPGETFEAELTVERNGGRMERLDVALRRIVATTETMRDRSGGTTVQPVFYETCGLSRSFGPDEAARVADGLPLRFDIPADAGGSAFAADNPAHWELIVEGEGAGRPYATAFWIPVYAQPAA